MAVPELAESGVAEPAQEATDTAAPVVVVYMQRLIAMTEIAGKILVLRHAVVLVQRKIFRPQDGTQAHDVNVVCVTTFANRPRLVWVGLTPLPNSTIPRRLLVSIRLVRLHASTVPASAVNGSSNGSSQLNGMSSSVIGAGS